VLLLWVILCVGVIIAILSQSLDIETNHFTQPVSNISKKKQPEKKQPETTVYLGTHMEVELELAIREKIKQCLENIVEVGKNNLSKFSDAFIRNMLLARSGYFSVTFFC
jgi:hypothetical protein